MADLGPSQEPDWLVPGWIARGAVTLLTGHPKAGKTTLLYHALRDIHRGSGLATKATDAPVVVVTEEHHDLWRERRDALDLPPTVMLVETTGGGFARLDHPGWRDQLDWLTARTNELGIALVVFDTLASAWPVINENDASEVAIALAPLRALTAAGAAVLLVHHSKKSDGEQGTGTRGSSALPGFADIHAELRRYDPSSHADTRRTIVTYGRYRVPPETVIDLADDGYVIVGDRAVAKGTDADDAIRDILPRSGVGATWEEIHDQWPTTPTIGKTALKGRLNYGATHGHWERSGSGVKGDPYRYRAKEPSDSIQSAPTPRGRIEMKSAPATPDDEPGRGWLDR